MEKIITLQTLSTVVSEILGGIGILIMLYGALRAVYMFVIHVCCNKFTLPNIRINLGKYFALGLEFLVGKDIVESLIHPSWDELGKLATIIVLRCVVTIFLWWELKEVEEEIKAGISQAE